VSTLERIPWRRNPSAVELGFEFYLEILETRLAGEEVSLVQKLLGYFHDELEIDLRETQARGLMHSSASVFIEYVKQVSGLDFNPSSEYWSSKGLKAFRHWKQHWAALKSRKASDVGETPSETVGASRRTHDLTRRTVTINRIIRDTALARFMKGLYDYRCQICGYTFALPGGLGYCEMHHIRPLGAPHNGDDVEGNLIALCPLHHAMFDYGVIGLAPSDSSLVSIDPSVAGIGKPLILQKHKIEKTFLEYHLQVIFGRENPARGLAEQAP